VASLMNNRDPPHPEPSTRRRHPHGTTSKEISAYDSDVIVVTEFRTTSGIALCAATKERGLPYVENDMPRRKRERNHGLLADSDDPHAALSGSSGCRWIDIELPDHGFGVWNPSCGGWIQ
jgi:hypothetical protein